MIGNSPSPALSGSLTHETRRRHDEQPYRALTTFVKFTPSNRYDPCGH